METRKLSLCLLLAATAALAFAATYPLTITRVEIKDYAGFLKTTFKRGEIVIVETEIYAEPAYYAVFPLTYLEIITMWHGHTMLGLTLTRANITTGETRVFGGGMGIRMTDPLGTYTIEVYVWNGFPSEVGPRWAPLAARVSRTITVTG